MIANVLQKCFAKDDPAKDYTVIDNGLQKCFAKDEPIIGLQSVWK